MECRKTKRSHCQQIKSMLSDAIKVLCSNTISHSNCLSIEALIGITVDNAEVILINVQEVLEKAKAADDSAQNLGDGNLAADVESISNVVMPSNSGCVKTDPNTDDGLFDILSDDVIQIEDEEKKELEDLQATICIKEEDQLECLINNGNYDNQVYRNSSQMEGDGGFFMTGQFYPNNSVSTCDGFGQVSQQRLFPADQKWQTFPPAGDPQGQQFQARNARPGGFNCRLCRKNFATQAVYLRHKKKYHQPGAKAGAVGAFSDAVATAGVNGNHGNSSDESWMMAASLGRKNMVLSEEVTNMTVYTCSICGKTIRHQSSFLRHKRQHEGIVYKCDLCGAVISRRDALQVHKRKCAMRLQHMADC